MSEINPKCPHCKSIVKGFALTVTATPDTGPLAVVTFCCPFCDLILGVSWLPKDAASQLRPFRSN